ncbi:hypothetical protein DFH08DRAFT_920062 [Mycena albidolilacea]|uniref:Peptidase C15, pyroglutamyl peptidase I-like protein n=1 Tax=Mycena albidolilacea TaxID=1033008 RepID=A0AAD7AW36_9AGAR|nr:hypothetical protein DFH08DRAFT_920062 [Mycena albidolilacea]
MAPTSHTCVKYKVLVTGGGPFDDYKVDNPAWLAVRTLHEKVITTTPPPTRRKAESIHITALQIPVVYTAVLDIFPGLHAAPPVLPPALTSTAPPSPDKERPFDLIIHVGVGRNGPLRAERLAHKTGYDLPDYEGRRGPLVAGGDGEGGDMRGFGPPRYGDEFADELFTSIDVEALVGELASGIDPVPIEPSSDAGRYLCDFMFYASLAEAQRAGRGTPVLFVHCPPVGREMNTSEVAEGIRRILAHVCGRF